MTVTRRAVLRTAAAAALAPPLLTALAEDEAAAGTRTGETTSYVGTYVYPPDWGVKTYGGACAAWSKRFSRTIRARRQYFRPSEFPTSIGQFRDDIAAGRRVTLSFKPQVAPSASDRAALDKTLAMCKTAGLKATVALWHEPKSQQLTAAQYARMIAYYGPVVRSHHYWLGHCQSSWPIASGQVKPDTYLSACPAGSFDLVAADVYAPDWLRDRQILATFSTLADDHGLPLALFEFNANPAYQTHAQVAGFFTEIHDVFAARKRGGRRCGDLLLFDTSKGTPNCSFVGAGDFRIPLVRQIYDLMNGAVT